MFAPISRRRFIAGSAGVLARAEAAADRLGVMCQIQPDENSARKVLSAARRAGFPRVQITFPWDRTDSAFLRDLPRWVAAEDLKVDAIGAYVNCAAPQIVIMGTRAQDFDRAIEFAPAIGTPRLVAWTGGFGPDLMAFDPRNSQHAAADSISRFLDSRVERLSSHRLTLALETYITLVCPDATSLRTLLDRFPGFITCVMDPPNMTPVDRYGDRDAELDRMFRVLNGRIGIVHMKDFRLAKDGRSYELPGPLQGVMNYRRFVHRIRQLPAGIPAIAEHIGPEDFARLRPDLVRYFGS